VENEAVVIGAGMAYSTRLYRRREGELPGWQAAFTLPTAPHEKANGLAVPIEGDRWMIAMGGWHLSDPATDPDAFEAAAKALPDPIIADLMARAEPLSDITGLAVPVQPVPWSFATGSDFGYPETTGPRPPGLWFTKWFARRIAYASQIDAGINRTLVGVQQLLVPPSVLGRPGFVLRVLRQARRRLRQP
jgi:hypothetical protein